MNKTMPFTMRNAAAHVGLAKIERRCFSKTSPAMPTGTEPTMMSQARCSAEVETFRALVEDHSPAMMRPQSRQ